MDENGAASRASEIIYQVYPASFKDTNGDGIGDIAGVTEKLDYIHSLGVDAIWISPFYPSPEGPEGDGGYAVSNYREIDPVFGTMDDFKDFLAKAHDNGLKVYTDWVLCHTAFDHDWFEKSRRREDGFEDFYIWHDGGEFEGEHVPPNNWKSVFGGPAWTWDDMREQYYLHHFAYSQPALNLSNDKVVQAVLKEMAFWLDMGVDGFRLDAVPFAFTTKDRDFKNNPWLDGEWPEVYEDWKNQYFEYSMCHDETRGLVETIRAFLDSYGPDKLALGEAIAGPHGGEKSVPVAAKYVANENYGGDIPGKGLDMCYTNLMMGIVHYPTPEQIRYILRETESHFHDGGNCNSYGNHDMPRSASRMTEGLAEENKPAALRQMFKLALTMPGSLCLYQGEELGLPQAHLFSDIPEEKIIDPVYFSDGPDFCRDGERTPVPWVHDQPNAGFSNHPDPPRPVPDSHINLAVDLQDGAPESFLTYVRDMIAWRKNQPCLIKGETILLDTPDPVVGFVRDCEEQAMLFLYNISGDEQKLNPSDFLSMEMMEKIGIDKDATVHLCGLDYFYTGETNAPPNDLNQSHEPGL